MTLSIQLLPPTNSCTDSCPVREPIGFCTQVRASADCEVRMWQSWQSWCAGAFGACWPGVSSESDSSVSRKALCCHSLYVRSAGNGRPVSVPSSRMWLRAGAPFTIGEDTSWQVPHWALRTVKAE